MWRNVNGYREKLSASLKKRQEVHVLVREYCISSGYRPLGTPFMSCLASPTVLTNETFNIWTHAVPAVLTSLYTIWLIQYSPEFKNVTTSTASWPCLFFLFATTLHLSVSTLAHTFNSLSFASYQIWFFCDYMAISITGLGIAITNDAYAFPVTESAGFHRDIFLPVAALFTVIFTYLACSQRYKMHFKTLKASVLFISIFHYCWVYYPVVKRILECDDPTKFLCHPEAIRSYSHHLYFMALSALIFGLHFPEILSPGTFDLFGHSHQVFHVLNFLGSISMFQAVRSDMNYLNSHYQSEPTSAPEAASLTSTRLFLMFIIPVINFSIMLSFVHKVQYKKKR